MKKLTTILIAVALIFAMAVPVFASEISDQELVRELPTPYTTNYYTILVENGAYGLWVTSSIPTYVVDDTGSGAYWEYTSLSIYLYKNETWEFAEQGSTEVTVDGALIYRLSYNLMDADGHIYMTKSSVFADQGNSPDNDTGTTVEYCTSHYPYENGVSVCPTCGLTRKTTGATDTIKGYDYPALSTVWNEETYPACAIMKDKTTGEYWMVFGDQFTRDYIYDAEWLTPTEPCYFLIGGNYERYNLEGDTWVYHSGGDNQVMARVNSNDLIWASETIYTDSTRVHDFFYVPPTMAGNVTETMLTAVLTEIVAILPMTIPFLVGYLALRKALAILATLLYQA